MAFLYSGYDGLRGKVSGVLIHAYLGIDEDTIWSIVRDDIPAIIAKLEEIL